ncbi:MAG: cytochrome c [Verrucomicrobia bacterium]|nr:cytochrome c [Verrucomicrobiota bacterium]
MKPDPKKPQTYELKDGEPSAGFATVPIWLVVAFGLAAYWGGLHIDKHGGEFDPVVYEPYLTLKEVKQANPKNEGPDPALGKEVYGRTCIGCHQPTGIGVPGLNPSLVNSEWVLAKDPNRIIRAVLDGFTGPVTVMGQPFNSTMVAWRPILKDDDIAAVLTYVRQEWGNKAPAVSVQQVKALREKTADHDGTPYKAEELLQIQEGQ